MIIERIRLQGFGPFHRADIPLVPGFNLFFGANESGKTTLAEAVFAALYGLQDTTRKRARPREEVQRLAPWSGGNFQVALDLVTDAGHRLALTREMGGRRDVLTVFDAALGEEVSARFGEGFGETLLGMAAQSFRDTCFIPQMRLAPEEAASLGQVANLEETGREDTSLGEAMAAFKEAYTRLGKTDNAAGTLIGRAIAHRNDLERELRAAHERREHLFADEGRVAPLKADLTAKEATLADLERHLAGRLKREAVMRLKRIGELREALLAVGSRIKELEPYRSVDVMARARLRENLEGARQRLQAAEDRVSGLEDRIRGIGADEGALPEEGWEDRAEAALRDRLSAGNLPAAKRPVWPLVLAGVLALAGVALLVERIVPIGLGLLALAAGAGLAMGLVKPQSAEVQRRRREAEENLRRLAAEAGLESLTAEAVGEIRSRRQRSAERSRLETELEGARENLDGTREEVRRLEEATDAWAGGEDEAAVVTAQGEIKNLDEKNMALTKELARLEVIPEDALRRDAEADADPEEGDPAELQVQVEALRREVADGRVRLRTLEEEVARHRGDLAELPELEAAFQRSEAEVARLQTRRRALMIAEEVLKEADESYRRDVVPRLNQKVARFIRRFSEGRYGEAAVGQEKGPKAGLRPSVRTPGDGQFRPPAALSQGTGDLVYLALRLALAELLPGEVAPLILDDPSVNLDTGRTRGVLGALAELSERRQVLYLTCHEREATLAEALGAAVVKGPWEAPGAAPPA